jgi:hypothetical protein
MMVMLSGNEWEGLGDTAHNFFTSLAASYLSHELLVFSGVCTFPL